MAEHDSETAAMLRVRPDEARGRIRIMRIAGGGHDNDNDDDYQGSDGHDDTGHGDHDLSNQDPDSDD